jgi:putative nucleotidyltransferase with HDIG domain
VTPAAGPGDDAASARESPSAAVEPLAALAAAAAEAGARAWLVGGAVRDRLLGRATLDLDAVVTGDPAALARAVGRRASGHAFELSEAFGGWRVSARDRRWQLDLLGLVGAGVEEDLARRDLTINAIAQPLLAGGEPGPPIDPSGGVADLHAGRLRMVSERSFRDDPLRVLRLARFAAQLGFATDPATLARARESAGGLAGVAGERTFAELRGVVCAPGALAGLALMDELGATGVVLPELASLRGVEQSGHHHLDVSGHTRATLAETIALVEEPSRLGIDPETTERLAAALARPLANELTRGQALRFGALLHDIAKAPTRAVSDEGRVSFWGHDELGAEMAREILGRLRASERLRAHVAALTRSHLRLGFLVHRTPLSRRELYDYLMACAPVAVDVTVLSVADRLATRGANAGRAIEAHLRLAAEVLPAALAFEAEPPRPPLRGDELAAALGIEPGPRLGELLAELQAAAYAGEIEGREDALTLARELLARSER